MSKSRREIHRQQDHTLCAFDFLEFDDEDLRRTPIELRKATLKGLPAPQRRRNRTVPGSKIKKRGGPIKHH